MKKSKSVEILKTFSVKELKEFEKLISSPFFSTGRNLMPFYKAVKRFYPDFNNDKFTDENIFKALYADKPFKQLTIRKLNADLMKLALEFLKQVALKNNTVQENMIISRECQKRQLYSVSKKLIADSDSYLESEKINDFYYHRKEVINDQKDGYVMNNGNKNDMIEQTGFSNRIVTGKFIYLGLYGYLNMIHFKNAYKTDVEQDILFKFINSLDLPGLVKNLESMNSASDKFILMNLYSILSWKHMDNDEYFYKFKELIYRHFEILDWDMKNITIINLKYLITFKGTLYNFTEYKKELFDIHKFILKKKIHINKIHKSFPKEEFVNHFTSGFENKEYEWSEDFIKKYSKDLSVKNRSDAINYCKAHLEFVKKDYDSCLLFLNAITVKDEYEKIAIYYLKSAVFYEKGLYEDVLTMLEVFYKYVNRDNKMRKDRKQFHLNFINCVKDLVGIKLNSGKKDKHELQNSFKLFDHKITMENWVKKCISEI